MLRLDLFTLGAPEARMGDELKAFRTRKTLALLVFLAIVDEIKTNDPSFSAGVKIIG